MGALDILLGWVSDLTDPMGEFRAFADALNAVHSDSLQAFRQKLYELDPNQALQQNTLISGDFVTAMQQTVNDFLRTAEDLSQLRGALNQLEKIADDMEDTSADIEDSVEVTAAELEGESGLIEVTADVDIAAVAEGGIDPIADIAGFILTLIVGAEVLDDLKNLAEDIYNDVQDLKRDLQDLANAIDPSDPPEPTHVPVKAPGWQSNTLTAQQQQELQALEAQYGYLAGGDPQLSQELQNILKSLLQMGLSQADIQQIMTDLTDPNNHLTDAQILAFLHGIVTNDGDDPNSPNASAIKKFFQLASRSNAQYPLAMIVREYADIATIPGASRLLAALIETSTLPSPKDGYRGYQFELAWIDAHRGEVARIEDIVQAQRNGKPIQGNVQAADVVFKSGPFTKGAVVDTKSYTWVTYVNGVAEPKPDWQIQLTIADFIKQAKRDQANYPGYPVVFVFDAGKGRGTLPQSVINALTQAGVTVMTSPPDKVVGVAQPQSTPSATGGGSMPSLPSGGDGPPQLPSGGDGFPELPSGE